MTKRFVPMCLLVAALAAADGVAFQSTPEQPGPGRMTTPPSSTLPAGGIDLPIVALAPNPVVEVRVNGQGPFRFMLDTAGAGHARADVSLVARLGLDVVGQVRAGDGTGRGSRMMDIVRFGTLNLGEAEFRAVDAPSRDYNTGRTGDPIDGVLGLGLFADYLLVIDLPARRLRVMSGALPPPDARRVLPLSLERGVPGITVRVADRDVPAHIDTGSMGALLLPMALAKGLPLAGSPAEVGRARTVTNEFVIYEATLEASALIGAHELPRPVLQFSEIFPRANVGMRVLGDFVITIDQRQSRIAFDRGRAPGTAF